MSNVEDLVQEWNERLRIAADAHYRTARRLLVLGKILEGLAILVTTASAIAAFTSVASYGWIMGTIGAILMMLSLAWHPEMTANEHRNAGAAFYAIRRELEILSLQKIDPDKILDISRRYHDISPSSPLPISKIYSRSREKVKNSATPDSADPERKRLGQLRR